MSSVYTEKDALAALRRGARSLPQEEEQAFDEAIEWIRTIVTAYDAARGERDKLRVIAKEARQFITDTASMNAEGRIHAFDRLFYAVRAWDGE